MTDEVEMWRPVVGYEGVYEVSSFGCIRRIGNGRHLKTYAGKRGYRMASLWKGGVARLFSVHRLVCFAFHGAPTGKLECAHLDGNGLNNNAADLCWATKVENQLHKKLHGTQPCGEDLPWHKLTTGDVHEMFRLRYEGVPATRIAEKFSVGRDTAFDVLRRVTWKHVTINPLHLKFKRGTRWHASCPIQS